MLLLINNLHKNVRDKFVVLTYVYSEHSTGEVFLALLLISHYTRTTLTAWNSVNFVSLV
jgi:hypothetical protein